MQIFRTVLWVLILVAVATFVAMNWTVVPINLVPGTLSANGPASGTGAIGVSGPLGVIVLLALLAGAVPTYLVAKAARWRLHRRIAALENTIKASTPTPMIATSTQFDAADASLGVAKPSPTKTEN